jgi:hypothetical protein
MRNARLAIWPTAASGEEQYEPGGDGRRDEQATCAAAPDPAREISGQLTRLRHHVGKVGGHPDHHEGDAPEDLLARLRPHMALAGVHRGQRQRHHDDGAHQYVDDDHDAQRGEHRAGQFARRVAHVAR